MFQAGIISIKVEKHTKQKIFYCFVNSFGLVLNKKFTQNTQIWIIQDLKKVN